ncbi:MAG: redoxin domain-containing protein [Fimbriimonadaceae bacterium]|nr:redoxin domain-containing protein [Fimbriimonadaceae bacterium]
MIEFVLPGSDGQTWSSAALHGNGPVALHFIKKTCPVNAGAMTYFKRMALAIPIRYVGVIDGDATAYSAYQAMHQMPFPCILDPDRELIAGYDVLRSPTLILFDGATERERWESFSAESLPDMARLLAAACSAEMPHLEFPGAPDREKFG